MVDQLNLEYTSLCGHEFWTGILIFVIISY